jgi:surface antigen
MMGRYSIIVSAILLFLIIVPVVALGSLTNLLVLSSPQSGPNKDIYLYVGGLVPGNSYDFGNCTFWVAILRSKAGDPIPNTWGDAITWAERAQHDGYLVDHTPTINAIMQDPNAPGGFGHVAYVENVDPNSGEWTISEMNRVGFDEVDTRVMPAMAASSYNFIHNK